MPRDSAAGLRVCVRWHLESGAKQRSKTQQRVLKRGVKTILVKEAAGTTSEVMCVTFEEAAGSTSVVLKINFEISRLDNHNVQISDCRYVDKVFENLRQKLHLRFCILDAKTNVLMWGLLMSTTMESSVHLGLQHQENLLAHKNTNFEKLKTLFDITLNLIVEQSFDVLNVSSMIHTFSTWMRSTQCHDQVIKRAKAKVHVYPERDTKSYQSE